MTRFFHSVFSTEAKPSLISARHACPAEMVVSDATGKWHPWQVCTVIFVDGMGQWPLVGIGRYFLSFSFSFSHSLLMSSLSLTVLPSVGNFNAVLIQLYVFICSHGQVFAHWTAECQELLSGNYSPVFRLKRTRKLGSEVSPEEEPNTQNCPLPTTTLTWLPHLTVPPSHIQTTYNPLHHQ